MTQTKPVIVGISGSLRSGSFNTALLRAAVELAPPSVTLEVGSIRGIPLYDGDVETASGIPVAVQELKERIAKADGLLLVTPEYNNSIPGVFKNAIDWLSRPGADVPRVFGNRPVAVIGASPGRYGTLLSQTAWLPILRTLGMNAWFGPRLAVGGASRVFDEQGRLVDEAVKKQLTEMLVGFADFVTQAPRRGTQP